MAVGLFAVAAYQWARASAFDDSHPEDAAGGPTRPPAAEVIVLAILGCGALGAALILRAPGGGVRLPTPARLEELAGRAEGAAVERAEQAATSATAPDQPSS
jgi:hypothetical protein